MWRSQAIRSKLKPNSKLATPRAKHAEDSRRVRWRQAHNLCVKPICNQTQKTVD
ncbi:MAG: hypothetical protein MUC60_17530 [Oscillatoria sp. Prado101]|nr:hypothetical protein [Oscillatoria sp. Prado101]